jgi:HK97 family phage major capsid protein
LIRIPSEIDEDSIVALGQFIARYAARQMARCEDYQAFRSTGAGSGVNGTAEGLTKSVVTDGIKIDQASGKTKQSDATLQNFRDLRSSSGLNGAALENAAYYVHPTYEALFCTFNTSATVVPYQRAAAGSPATLDGFRIVWVPVMPAYSTTASASLCHALFGDATFNYLGVRGGMRFDTSREAAFTTDEILVRALERMTVGKMATDAVAGLVTAAS